LPLTLTILSAAVPPERRGVALGAWGGISGLAIAFGPLGGGAVAPGISWHWIFWLNVPIGIVLVPLVLLRLPESRGPLGRFDLRGLGLASAGLLGLRLGGARERRLARHRLGARSREQHRLELARDPQRARRRGSAHRCVRRMGAPGAV